MLVLNKDNVGQYVDGNGYHGSENNWLTKDAFVTLWQTSVSIEEFIERCMLINKLLLEKYGTRQYASGYISPKVQITAKWGEVSYKARANRYRKKGVNLKKLQRRTPKERNTSEWDRLAKLAEQLA